MAFMINSTQHLRKTNSTKTFSENRIFPTRNTQNDSENKPYKGIIRKGNYTSLFCRLKILNGI
jgi:hypothetical protein